MNCPSRTSRLSSGTATTRPTTSVLSRRYRTIWPRPGGEERGPYVMTAPAAMVGSIELAVIRTDPAVGSAGVVVDVCTFALGLATLFGAIPLLAVSRTHPSG